MLSTFKILLELYSHVLTELYYHHVIHYFMFPLILLIMSRGRPSC